MGYGILIQGFRRLVSMGSICLPDSAKRFNSRSVIVASLFIAWTCCPEYGAAQVCPSTYLAGIDLTQAVQRRHLPRPLFEISGANWYRSALIAHDDNVSRLWSVPEHGDITEIDTGVAYKGDYEDLTFSGNTAYLLRSNGNLLRIPLATESPSAQAINTTLKGRCNFEGLAVIAHDDFVAACKYVNTQDTQDIHLYRFNPFSESLPPQRILVDVSQIRRALNLTVLRPSALHWLAEKEHLLVLAGKERVLMEVDLSGRVLIWRRLSWWRHRQAEALTLDPQGNLYIGDERNRWFATLTQYGHQSPMACSTQQ